MYVMVVAVFLLASASISTLLTISTIRHPRPATSPLVPSKKKQVPNTHAHNSPDKLRDSWVSSTSTATSAIRRLRSKLLKQFPSDKNPTLVMETRAERTTPKLHPRCVAVDLLRDVESLAHNLLSGGVENERWASLKLNLTFAINTADKLAYQIRNWSPLQNRFSVPQWNPLPALPLTRGGRSGDMHLVIGLSTVNRATNYLLATVKSLFDGMSTDGTEPAVVVVFNGNYPPADHREIAAVRSVFAAHIQSGALQIIERSEEDANDELFRKLADPGASLAHRWGDSTRRVMWRSKQNLDVAFLLDHVARQSFGRCGYFLMMEDDIVTARGFVGKIRKWADAQLLRRTDWTVASFYNPWAVQDLEMLPAMKFFGVIGQLIRIHDVPVVVEFIRRNFDQSPLDWLLVDFFKRFQGRIVAHTPSYFQHQGETSSFAGKTQEGKSVDFDDDTPPPVSG